MTVPADEIFSCITNSIIRFSEDFRQAHFPSAVYFDWDAHAQISEIPEQDCIGPAGMGLSDEGQITQIAFSIGMASVDDENLFRLRAAMSKLYGALKPETVIPIYDLNGQRFSWLVVKTPVIIAPVSKSEVRAVQFINVMGLLDPHATSSLG